MPWADPSRRAPACVQAPSALGGVFQAYGEHVTGGTVQHVIGGRAQQQGQAVTSVTADHNKIAVLFFGQAMNLLAWLAVGQVALLWCQLRVALGEVVQALAGLVELLLLQHRQVHRHITTKGHGMGSTTLIKDSLALLLLARAW